RQGVSGTTLCAPAYISAFFGPSSFATTAGASAYCRPRMRPDGRRPDELRPITITPDCNRYAEGSALIAFGETQVICTASVEEKVPGFLEGKGKGWVTAEYAMLPRATHTRSGRAGGGRGQEIQRLIGRSLRAAIDPRALGPRQ